MVNLGTKAFIAVLAVVVIVTVVGFAAAANIGGIGSGLSNLAGPLLRGLGNLAARPLNFGLSSGFALLIFYLISFLVIPASVAYAVWHYDIPYKITNTVPDNRMLNNTVQREPADPETLTTAKAT